MTFDEHKKMYMDSLVIVDDENTHTRNESLRNLERFFGPDVWKDLEHCDFKGHLYAPELTFRGHWPIKVSGKTDKPSIFMYDYSYGCFRNSTNSLGEALVKSETPLTKIKNFLRR